MTTKEEPIERVPMNIIPRHYDLTLQLDLLNCSFHGFVITDIDVKKATNTVRLNSEKLNVTKASLLVNGRTMNTCDVVCEESQSTSIITFPEVLANNLNGRLKVEFEGLFEGENFYSCVNISDDGIPSLVAAIRFDSSGAKRCFPCWDDPNHKATFNLTLVVSQEFNTISNTPIKSETNDGDMKTVVFDKTPIMPTHSLAVVLGEFDFLETKVNETVIRVYTPKNQSDRAKFSLETIAELLTFYNTYFEYPYPLSKLDSVELDLGFDTVDSWGLLIFTEPCLLADTKEPMNNAKKQSARLKISRKLVGQWTGTLVSPKNWQEFWFHDGLATFFQYMSVSEQYAHHGSVFEDFVCNQLTNAFEIDSQPETKPIIRAPDSFEAWNEVSHLKTPSLLWMLQTLMGPETFRESTTSFLKLHAFQSCSAEDFWQFLEETSHQPVLDIMSSWTKQAGYPVLTVEQTQKGDKKILSIHQQRFLANGSSDDSLWVIPVSLITAKRPHEIRHKATVPATRNVELVFEIDEDVWVAFHVGYYRVLYSRTMLDELMSAIHSGDLHEMHRFSILNDLFNSAKAGYACTEDLLSLIPAYQQDKSYMVWSGIINSLSQIDSLVSHLPIHEDLTTFCTRLYAEVCDWIGWDEKAGESYLMPRLRSLVLENMAVLQDSCTILEAEKRFERHLAGHTLPESLRTCVYIGVVSSGNEVYLEQLLDIYFKTDSEEEKARVFLALGAARNERMLRRILALTVSEEIHPKYGKLVFRLMSLYHTSREMAWHFVKKHWPRFSRKYCGEYMSRLKKWATQGFASETMAEDVKIFFTNHEQFLDDPVYCFVNQIMVNAKWLKRDRIQIERTICFYVSE